MGWFRFILIVIIVVYVIFRFYRATVKSSAVNNAFLAKYTYSQLTDFQKQQVHNQTLNIMKRGGMNPMLNKLIDKDFSSLNEISKFSLYALTMAELGIPPALSNEQWVWVRDPRIELWNAKHHIEVTKYHFAHTHNVRIDFD